MSDLHELVGEAKSRRRAKFAKKEAEAKREAEGDDVTEFRTVDENLNMAINLVSAVGEGPAIRLIKKAARMDDQDELMHQLSKRSF